MSTSGEDAWPVTRAAAEVGYSYREMGSRIVNPAAARYPVFRKANKPAASTE